MNEMMRPTKMLLLVAVMLVVALAPAAAADFEIDEIAYNVIGENQVEVAKRDSAKYTGEVFIPATVSHEGTTYQVTRIGRSAFSYCPDLTLVEIPEGVTEIADYGFSYCRNLQNIDLPNTLISVGKSAFSGCSSFTSFHVPRNLASIEYDTFCYLSSLAYYTCSTLNKHFKAVDGVLYSKDMTMLVAYPPADSRTTFDVPSTVTHVHEYCFSGSNNLVTVIFPESLTWIGMNIFRECKGLVEVDIPDGVKYMGITVFGGCINLERVHLPASLDSIMNSTFSSCEKLTEITIPRNVSYIDEQGFINVRNLKTITLEPGSRLKEIGPYAFRDCISLESFDMQDSVTTIGNSCFNNCRSLRSVHMSKRLQELGAPVFWDCFSLIECEIPGGVPTIRNAFINCTSLKRVILGSKDATPGTTILENATIGRCEQIEYLELGANIDSLATSALNSLNNIKVIICWAPVPPRCHDYWGSFDPSPQSMDAPLYVPKAALQAYRTANEWKNFKTIVPIEDLGDVDGNGAINVSDVTTLISQMLNTEALDHMQLPLADLNLDGSINIADVTLLISKMMNEQP